MGIKVYRIYAQDRVVGIVASASKEAAEGYALGKYGASTSLSEVAIKTALEAGPVCVLIETAEVLASSIGPLTKLRVIV